MGLLSILLNLIFIGFVGFLIYAIKQLYKLSESKNIPVLDLMTAIENDPSSISHSYFYEQSGAWSIGDGIDWSDDMNSKNITLYDI